MCRPGAGLNPRVEIPRENIAGKYMDRPGAGLEWAARLDTQVVQGCPGAGLQLHSLGSVWYQAEATLATDLFGLDKACRAEYMRAHPPRGTVVPHLQQTCLDQTNHAEPGTWRLLGARGGRDGWWHGDVISASLGKRSNGRCGAIVKGRRKASLVNKTEGGISNAEISKLAQKHGGG